MAAAGAPAAGAEVIRSLQLIVFQSLSNPLRAALLTSALLAAPACSVGDGPPAEIPWPHELAGYDDALVAHLEAARADVLSRPREADAWVHLGMLFEAHLMLQLAEASYAVAVQLDDGDARVWYRLAVMQGKNGKVGAALEAYERLEALEEYGPGSRRKGWLLLGAGQPWEAWGAFERAEGLSHGDPVAHLGRVEVLLEVDKPEEALGTLELIGPIPPASRALFHRLRGLALSRLSRFEEAEPELAKGRGARIAGPDPWMKEVAALKVGASAILLQANRRIESGQPEAALEQLRLLEERDPDDPRIFVRKGRAFARLDDWSGAAAALSRATELSPDDLGLALALASATVKAGEVDRALVAAERLIELDPQLTGAHELRADLLLGEGRAGEAAAAVEHSRTLGVVTASLEVTAGKATLELGDAPGALAAFEAAIVLDRGSADALAGKALASLQLGESAGAAAAVGELRRVEPEHPLLQSLEAALISVGGGDSGATAVEAVTDDEDSEPER